MDFFYGLVFGEKESPVRFPPDRSWKYFELPGEQFASSGTLPALPRGAELLLGDFCQPELARSLPEAAPKFQGEFEVLFRQRCRMAAKYGVTEVSAGFDFLRALDSPAYEEKLRRFLLICCRSLEENGITLRIPLRIPGPDPRRFLALLHRMLYPGLRLLPEFHPHEPEAFECLGTAAKSLRFESFFWKIVYEPGLGNYLSPELLRRFCRGVEQGRGEQCAILLAPQKTVMSKELAESLAVLVRSVETL